MSLALTSLFALIVASSDVQKFEAVFIEWIPLGQNTTLCKLVQENLDELGNSTKTTIRLTRVNVRGNEKELDKRLAEYSTARGLILVAVGDFVSQRAASTVIEAPIVAVNILDVEPLEDLMRSRNCSGTIVTSPPSPADILELATRDAPPQRRLGVIFTKGYRPNEKLAADLGRVASARSIEIVPLLVDRGFCRTDADFERLISDVYSRSPFTALYAPQDPNCDRFLDTICRKARSCGIRVIGSNQSERPGLAAAFVPDQPEIADAVVQSIGQFVRGTFSGRKTIIVPPKQMNFRADASPSVALPLNTSNELE